MEKYIVLTEIQCAGDDESQVQRNCTIHNSYDEAEGHRTELVDKLTSELDSKEMDYMKYDKEADNDVVTVNSWDDDVYYSYRIIKGVEV